MKTQKKQKTSATIQTKGFECIKLTRMGGCGEGWTCDRCPNYGCPANERN